MIVPQLPIHEVLHQVHNVRRVLLLEAVVSFGQINQVLDHVNDFGGGNVVECLPQLQGDVKVLQLGLDVGLPPRQTQLYRFLLFPLTSNFNQRNVPLEAGE